MPSISPGFVCTIPLAMLMAAPTALAQSAPSFLPADDIAYVAFAHTPAGLFGPVIKPLDQASGGRWALAARFSRLPRSERNNATDAYGATVETSVARSTMLALTVGQYRGECPDPECSWKVMLGVGVTRTLAAIHAVTVQLDGDFGWSEPEFSTSYFTGHVALPVALSIQAAGAFRIVPYIAPGFGVARAKVRGPLGETYSGSRPTVGAGVGLLSPHSGILVQVGAVHVPITNGATAVEIAVGVNR